VPDFARWDAREPVRRITLRDDPGPPPRPRPSERLPVHTEAVREPRLEHPVRPAPNAPLLMRIVRTPFALEPVKVTKRVLVEPYERVRLAPLGNPIRANPHGPEARPRPFRRTEGT